MPSVFSPTASAHIAAPPDKVFALLIDRTTWPRWNDFIPRADLISSSSPNPNANSDNLLHPGQTLHFHVRARLFGALRAVPGGSTERVNMLSTPADGNGEHGVWRVGWTQSAAVMPAWLMRTQRVNEVVVDGREGAECVYRTYMTFEGPVAYLVKWLSGWMVQEGLVMWAEGLKREAERGVE